MASLEEMLRGNNRSSGTPSTQRNSGPLRSRSSVSPQSSARRPRVEDPFGDFKDDDDKKSPNDMPKSPPRNPDAEPAQAPTEEMEALTPGKASRNVVNMGLGFAGGIWELGKALASTAVTSAEVPLDATIGLAEYATGVKLPGGWEKKENGENKTLGDYYRPGLDMAYGMYQGGRSFGKRGIVAGTTLLEMQQGPQNQMPSFWRGNNPLLERVSPAANQATADWYKQINNEVRDEFVQAWNDDMALEMIAGDIGIVAGGAGLAAGGVRMAAAGARGSIGAKAAHAAGASRYGLGARTVNWATRNKGTNRGARATRVASRMERVADKLDRFSYKADGYDPSIATWRFLSKHTKRVRISRGRKTQVFDIDGNPIQKQTYVHRLQKVAATARNRYLAHDLYRKLSNEKAKYEADAVDPQKTFKDHLGTDEQRAKNIKKGVDVVDKKIERIVTNLTAGTIQQWVDTYRQAVQSPNIPDPAAYVQRMLNRFNEGDTRDGATGKQLREETELKLEDIQLAAEYLDRTLPDQDLRATDLVIHALADQGDKSARKLIDSGRLSESATQQPWLDADGNLNDALTPEGLESLQTGKIPKKVKRLETQLHRAQNAQAKLRAELELNKSTRENYAQIEQGGADKALERAKKSIKAAEQQIAYYDTLIEETKRDLDVYSDMAEQLKAANDPVSNAVKAAMGVDASPQNIDSLIDAVTPGERQKLLDQWGELGDIKFVGTVIEKILELRHEAAKGLFFEQIMNFGKPMKLANGQWQFSVPWFNKQGLLNPEAAMADDLVMQARLEDFKTQEGRYLLAKVMKESGSTAMEIEEFLNNPNFADSIVLEDVTPRDYDPRNRTEDDLELEGDVDFWNESQKEWRQSAPNNDRGFNQPELLLNGGVQSLFEAMNRGTRRFGEDNSSFGDLYADKELVGLMATSINLPVETIEKFLQQLADPDGTEFMANDINASLGEIRNKIIEDLGEPDPMTGMWSNDYDDINARVADAVYGEFSTQGLDGVTESVHQYMLDNPDAAAAWLHAGNDLEAMMAVTDPDGKLFGMDQDGVLGDEQVASLIRHKAYLDTFTDSLTLDLTQSGLNAYAEMEGRTDVTARKFSRSDNLYDDNNAGQVDKSAEWTDVDGNAVPMSPDGTLSDVVHGKVAFLTPEDAAAVERQIKFGNYIRPGADIDRPILQGRDPNGNVYDISTHRVQPETGMVPVEWAEGSGTLDEFGDPIDYDRQEPFIKVHGQIAQVKPPSLTLTDSISDYFPGEKRVAEQFDDLLGRKTEYHIDRVEDLRRQINQQEQTRQNNADEIARKKWDLQKLSDDVAMHKQYDSGEGFYTNAMAKVNEKIGALEQEMASHQRTIDQAQPLLTQLKLIMDAPVETLNQPLSKMMADHLKGQAEGVRKIINSSETPNSSQVAAGWEVNTRPPNAGVVRYIKPADGQGKGRIEIGKGATTKSVIQKMLASLDDQGVMNIDSSIQDFIEAELVNRYEQKAIDWNDDPNGFLGEGTPMQRELFKIMEEHDLWRHVPDTVRNELAFELVKQDLNQVIFDAEAAGKIDPERPMKSAEASFTMMIDLQRKIMTQLERMIAQPEIDKINNYSGAGNDAVKTTRPTSWEASATISNELLNDLNAHFDKSFSDTIDFLDGEKYTEFDLQRLRMQYMPRNYRIIAKNGVELVKSQMGMLKSNTDALQGINNTLFDLRKRLAETSPDNPSLVRQMEHIQDQQLVADRLILENTQLAKDIARTPADLKRILEEHQNPNSLFNPLLIDQMGLNGVPYVRTGQGAQLPGRHGQGSKKTPPKVGTLDAEKSAGNGVVTADFDSYQRMEMAQAHEQMKSEMIRTLLTEMKYDGMFSWDAMNIPEVRELFFDGREPTLAEIGKAAADQGWQLVHQPRRDLQGTGQTYTGVFDLFDEAADMSDGSLWRSQVPGADLSEYKVIREEVSKAISDQLDSSKEHAFWQGADALTSMWKFTVLPIRVMWLVNNVFGNLAMAMISSGNKSNSLSEIAGAMKRVLDEEKAHLSEQLDKDMSYWDTIRHVQTVQDGAFSQAGRRRLNETNYSLSEYQGINSGMSDPDMGLQRGAALMSDPNYVVRRRNDAVEAEAKIADLTAKLEDPSLSPGEQSVLRTQLEVAQNVLPMSNNKAAVMKAGSTAVRGGYRANATIDSLFRAAVFNIENTRGLNKAGQDYRASRGQDRTAPLDAEGQAYVDGVASDVENKAIEKTLKALGDFTNLNYVEKAFVKRAIPFYPWLRHQLTMTLRLPIANPARAGLLIKIYDIMVDDEDKSPEWRAAFGSAIQTPWGKTNVLNGANPFTSPLESPLLPFSNNFASALNPIPKFALDLVTSSDIGSGSGQSRPQDQSMMNEYGNEKPTSALSRMMNGDVKGSLGEAAFKLSGLTGQTAMLRDAALSQFEGTGPMGRGKRNFTDGSFDSGDSRLTLQSNTTPLNKIFSGLGLPQLPFDQTQREQRVRRQAIQNEMRRNRNQGN